jgi:hypothetical protein
MWGPSKNKYKILWVNWAKPHWSTEEKEPGNLCCDMLARRWILATLTTP